MPRLVLASASPRRRELLALLGVPFDVMVSAFDEEAVPTRGLTPAQWVMRLAEGKARAAARETGDPVVVIGADTTVVLDGEYLNKPRDAADARAMLRRLSGRTHQVYTGVCVLEAQDGVVRRAVTNYAATFVTFDRLSEATIAAYVATGEPLDKAGAYGIQGAALAFIPAIQGDYFNVVGLPVELTRSLLLPCFPQVWPAPAQPHFPFPEYIPIQAPG